MSTTNAAGIAFYDSLGYVEQSRTAGDEVLRNGDDGFSMGRVERRVLCKALALRGGGLAMTRRMMPRAADPPSTSVDQNVGMSSGMEGSCADGGASEEEDVASVLDPL